MKAQAGRWMLWAPVAFGFGAALYINLRAEPPLVPTLAVAAAAIGLAWTARGRRWAVVLILAAFFAAGFAAGKLRTQSLIAPIVPATQVPRLVEGWVVDVASPGTGGGRLLIAPTRIEGLEALPAQVRITVQAEGAQGPGSAVRLLAIVGPPPPPAAPGAYDFARDAFFDHVGGSGFALTQPIALALPPAPWRLRAAMAVNAMRWSLARRIVARMGERAGGIAVAMTTGHKAWITPEQTEAMRASGLAHILSISGLHMAIVGGFVFALARLGIAGWPWLALRIDGKKAAALAGLMAVSGYLIVSGAPPPAERAAITAAVAFIAVLAGRKAISLHALAVAALAILALRPEAACEPGFQMSFSATAALVALAEAWPRAVREVSVPWPIRLAQGAAGWLALTVGASFVAGLATGPFAMQHFNRVAVYGLGANLAVAPLSSFVIMPFLALGAVLEPLGLGGPFLAVSGWGIDLMTWIAARTAAAPGSMAIVPSAPAAALPIAFLGILMLCLWRGRLRWLGLPMALAVLAWPRPPAPDIWIEAGGSTAAVREGKSAILLRPDSRRFAADLWARRRGLTEVEGGAWDCTRSQCVPKGQGLLAASWSRRAPDAAGLEALCAKAEVVVVRAPVSDVAACKGRLLLDGDDFARGGSAELWRQGSGWRIVWAQDLRGDRPWTDAPP